MAGSADKPIPVPFPVRMRHLLASHLQGALFAASLIAVCVLWFRQSPRVLVTGQVQRVEVIVPAVRDGILRDAKQPLGRFDRVVKNVTSLASLDVSEAMLQMQALTAERERLEAEYQAQSERLRQDQLKWGWEIEQHRLQLEQQVLDRQRSDLASRQRMDTLSSDLVNVDRETTSLRLKLEETDAVLRQGRLESEMLQSEQTRIDRLVELKMSSAESALQIRQRRSLLEQSLKDADQLRRLIDGQMQSMKKKHDAIAARLEDAKTQVRQMSIEGDDPSPLSTPPPIDAETTLEPYRQAIAVQDAKIGVLAQQIADSQIIAPTTGTITEVHQRAGAFVRSGEPILTIGSDERRWIVAYLDDRQAELVRQNAAVEIQVAGATTFVTASAVSGRGNQVESVPVSLRHDPRVEQWGIPIKVPIPAEIQVVPGQRVQLSIQ